MTEASLEIKNAVLCVIGCLDEMGEEFDVAPYSYRVRGCHANLAGGNDAGDGDVQFWPALMAAPVVLFALVATLLGRELQRAAAENAANDASPILETDTKVVAKRTQISGMENASTTYYATFEDNNGIRGEFGVSGSEYGILAEADRLHSAVGCRWADRRRLASISLALIARHGRLRPRRMRCFSRY
ncbi:hypothetical protein CCAX7_26280 [Capsulimonas corticalis]|uniref:Uncharacterized protein n=1 Tax=Capsulimonas corticalis TaxID=2219043 RepID=A0A402D6J7_9BACT|nr:DUF2500 family protein [Capsulimonas corticalis]BDI30577.1 hypothetical protein CCAX7_26280 [Capsulimonas corticalis]